MNLTDYIIAHSERNACRCGRCIDSGEDKALPEHTANMVFFDVALKGEPNKEGFLAAIKEHRGAFCEVSPLDGQEHSYIELGGWVGDQGLALQFMGLGSLLKVWDLLTPYTLLGDVDKDQAMQLAGMGLVCVQARDAAPVVMTQASASA